MDLLNPLTVYRADQRYLRYKQDVECLSSDSVGDFVAIRGDNAGEPWRVQKANPGDELKMPSVGLLISKSNSTTGIVQTYGPVIGIFSGLQAGRTYCLDYDGLRLGPPITGVNGYSWRQFVGTAVATNIFFLQLNPSITIKRS